MKVFAFWENYSHNVYKNPHAALQMLAWNVRKRLSYTYKFEASYTYFPTFPLTIFCREIIKCSQMSISCNNLKERTGD